MTPCLSVALVRREAAVVGTDDAIWVQEVVEGREDPELVGGLFRIADGRPREGTDVHAACLGQVRVLARATTDEGDTNWAIEGTQSLEASITSGGSLLELVANGGDVVFPGGHLLGRVHREQAAALFAAKASGTKGVLIGAA